MGRRTTRSRARANARHGRGSTTSSSGSSFNTSRQSFSGYGAGHTSSVGGKAFGGGYSSGGGWNTSNQGWSNNQYTAAYIAQKAKEEAEAKKKAEQAAAKKDTEAKIAAAKESFSKQQENVAKYRANLQKFHPKTSIYQKSLPRAQLGGVYGAPGSAQEAYNMGIRGISMGPNTPGSGQVQQQAINVPSINYNYQEPKEQQERTTLGNIREALSWYSNPTLKIIQTLANKGLNQPKISDFKPSVGFTTDANLGQRLGINTNPNIGSQYSQNFQGTYQGIAGPNPPTGYETPDEFRLDDNLNEDIASISGPEAMTLMGIIKNPKTPEYMKRKAIDTMKQYAPKTLYKNFPGLAQSDIGDTQVAMLGQGDLGGKLAGAAALGITTGIGALKNSIQGAAESLRQKNLQRMGVDPSQNQSWNIGGELGQIAAGADYTGGFPSKTVITQDHLDRRLANDPVSQELQGNINRISDKLAAYGAYNGLGIGEDFSSLATSDTNLGSVTAGEGPTVDSNYYKWATDVLRGDEHAPEVTLSEEQEARKEAYRRGLERNNYIRGLGIDTKALRRNQFSSGSGSNLDRSLAEVSGELRSTSDQIAQQANLGISNYLKQANEQRSSAQQTLDEIMSSRTDITSQIESLKKQYADVEGYDVSGLESLGTEYDTAIESGKQDLTQHDQNVRGYVTQWQQSTQAPQWTMGVRAKGNLYKSPLQQFGRKARTTSKKIKTPGSDFTIAGLSSAWNPTLNI